MKQKMNKNLIYLIWSGAIVVAAFLAVFCLIFASCARQEGETGSLPTTRESAAPQTQTQTQEAEAPETTQEPQETEAPTQSGARLAETADAGRRYLDRLTFLGDSTTYGIGYYYDNGFSDTLCPSTQIWTPKSGTLTLSYHSIATVVYPETGEEISIVDAVKAAKPDIMLITLGVNGVSFMDESWFKTEYTNLVNNIREASPDTKIILNSIYPVAASYQYQKDINNEKIRAANGWIEAVAESTGCRFLNSYEAVVGSDGNLPETAHNGDGIHLNGESFTKVMEYVRTHALSD